MALTVTEGVIIFVLPLILFLIVALIVYIVYSFMPQFPPLPPFPPIPPFPPTPSPTPPLNPVIEFESKDRQIIATDPQSVLDITRSGKYIVTVEKGGKLGVYVIGKSSRDTTSGATEPDQMEAAATLLKYHHNRTNDPIKNVVSAFGTIVGLTESGKVVKLKSSIQKDEWSWKYIKDLPNEDPVVYINASLDGNSLWATTKSHGYLLSNDVEVFDTPEKRVYGLTEGIYLIVDSTTNTATVFPEMEEVIDVSFAVLDCGDEVISADVRSGAVITGMRVICDKVYYLMKSASSVPTGAMNMLALRQAMNNGNNQTNGNLIALRQAMMNNRM